MEKVIGLSFGISLAALVVAMVNAAANGGFCERAGDLLSRIFRKRRHWDECPRFNAARKYLRAKLLTGGYGKHHAYCITRDGRVLVADAVDFYLALFAGVEDFWNLVAFAELHESGTHLLTRPLEQIDFGDGKSGHARIHYCGGETYIDAIPVDNLSHPYRCTWATAKEFKQAIADAQNKAAAGGQGDNDIKE